MNDIDINIDRFKEFVDSWKNGYRFALFSYVALKQQDNLTMIIAASIRLMPVLDTTKIVFFTHDSKSVTAGITHWEIEDNSLGFLAHIADGFILLPNGERMQLCNDKENNIWSQFNPGTDLIKNNQPRATSLRLSGSNIDIFFQNAGGLDEIDGELQSSTIPFNGLSDLCGALNLGWYQLTNSAGQKSELLVHAEQLLVLDRTGSIISDGKARLNLLIAPGLTRSQFKIGIRPWDGNYFGRKSFSGDDITWFEDDGVARGSVEISVGDTPAVLVLLSHDNNLFDRWWVFDPAKHINHHYAAYKAIDSDLTVLKRFLSGQSKNPGNDLESGITLLLGLFGFTVLHFGLTPSLQEAPDLLAFSEANQLAVIECTTGIPNENNKVSKLIIRTEQIRASLVNSGNAHIEVLPIIVTTSARDSVPKDIEEAGKHGVVVFAKEDIDSLIERIQFPSPLPSKLFVEAKSLLPLSELPSQE